MVSWSASDHYCASPSHPLPISELNASPCAFVHGDACRVDLDKTLPILAFLTLSQTLIFYTKVGVPRLVVWPLCARQRAQVTSVSNAMARELVFLLAFVAAESALVIIFLLEAFALPFGTKRGLVAFVQLDRCSRAVCECVSV